ncbi:hypothetical protein TNCV_4280211 [Trichonephila clavipes]|nr:hypothetical protein TNCV_4280211 [Trichonephila clavipes]
MRCCCALPEGKEWKFCQCLRQVGFLHDRWRHHLSPQCKHETGGERNILLHPGPMVSAGTGQNNFGPTDLTRMYSTYTRRVVGDIGHQNYFLRFTVQCPNH